MNHLLNPHLLALNVLPPNPQLAFLNPRQLVNPRRFGLGYKHFFAMHYLLGTKSQYPEALYVRHLGPMTGGTFVESDGSKSGSLAFVESFRALIDDMRVNGFDGTRSAVPVDRHHTAIDGGHRIATALALNQQVPVLVFDYEAPAYTSALFEGPDFERGLIEYCRIAPNARMLVAFPGCKGLSEIIKANELDVVGAAEYHFNTATAQNNLIGELYLGESWATPAGCAAKARACFGANTRAMILIVDGTPEQVAYVKRDIRAKSGIGHESIHATDTQEETLRVARVLLHGPSREFLSHGRPTAPGFEQLRLDFLHATQGRDPDHFCTDGSAVLGLYGLRGPGDWDYVHIGSGPNYSNVHSHNEWSERYPMHRDELIVDPALHFWSRGIKYATIAACRAIKQAIDEPKSREDLRLMEGL